ncbi:MAG: hypothetical protein MI725_12580 [Pirellulales bacterium]|nr:hypothetical protein [Pirellulales bacterium]
MKTTEVPEEELPRYLTWDLVNLFEAGNFSFHLDDPSVKAWRYRIFKPIRTENPFKQYPLIVWLHGFGEAGSDNHKQLRWLDFVFEHLAEPERYPFYLLAVQCPLGDNWTSQQNTTLSTSVLDPIMVVHAITTQLLEEEPIDKNRVSLAGVSSGGSGCWEMAARYPGLFTAVAPMSSAVRNNTRLDRLVGTRIWAFHNTNDRDASPESVRKAVHELQRLGGHCRLTEFQRAGHDTWSEAFTQYDLLSWLTRKHTRWSDFRDYNLSWDDWWPRLAVVAILLSMAYIIRRELRRQKRKAELETMALPKNVG